MSAVKYQDVCLARRLCPVNVTLPSKDDDDIVTYEEYDFFNKIGDGEQDFVVEKRVREASRVNRQAWIAKDAPDVGILNILEKVRRSGDATLFNQTHNVFEPSGEVDSLGRPLAKVQDYTAAPGSVSEALAAVAKGQESYESLKAILGDISYSDMANLSVEEINNILKSKLTSGKSSEVKGD